VLHCCCIACSPFSLLSFDNGHCIQLFILVTCLRKIKDVYNSTGVEKSYTWELDRGISSSFLNSADTTAAAAAAEGGGRGAGDTSLGNEKNKGAKGGSGSKKRENEKFWEKDICVVSDSESPTREHMQYVSKLLLCILLSSSSLH
jgi:hypothetical protein